MAATWPEGTITYRLAQIIRVLQDFVEFNQIAYDDFSVAVQDGERDEDYKLVRVVIRKEDLCNKRVRSRTTFPVEQQRLHPTDG